MHRKSVAGPGVVHWGRSARISQAILDTNFLGIQKTTQFTNFVPHQTTEAVLQQAELFAVFNHRSGLFFRGEASWDDQNNAGYVPSLPGDAFWQFNAFVGYRWLQRRAELRLGLLNITGQGYNMNPLNLYQELPLHRTITMRLQLHF